MAELELTDNNSDLKGNTTKLPYFTPTLPGWTVTSVPDNAQQHLPDF